MSFILALDQGTTSSRALLFDRAGAVRAVAQREFRQIFPHSGWVEHDPMEIWATQAGVMHEVLAKARVGARDVAAIGITNQRETTVLWERATGRPVANAIVWQDRRTAPLCDALRDAGHAGLFAARTGLVLDAYFSGTKLRWLLDHVPGARDRAARGELAFGTIDTWLVWNLTRGAAHVTDPSNASRTLLFNIHAGAWDDTLLDLLDVPREVLPRVVASSGVADVARLEGVEIPIAGIAGDQQAALFGQACHAPGLAKNTYGTGCFLLLNTGGKAVTSANNLLTTVAWGRDRALVYALEGSVFIGGAVVQWLRDGLKIIRSAHEIEALAATVADNGGVYLVPAFTGLGAPHWDAYARGGMFGLTRATTAGHIARAALEAIAFQSADVLAAMERDAGIRLAELRVDGGAAANNLLMQFQADVLGVPVVRPKVLETTALGAGYLAGLAVGYWQDAADVGANRQIDRVFTHSVQLPGGQGHASGGEREFIAPLARAAVAVGVDALFFEVHDDPDRALCDGPSQIPLDAFPVLLDGILAIDRAAREHPFPLL
jgi:glycerol kinase